MLSYRLKRLFPLDESCRCFERITPMKKLYYYSDMVVLLV